MMVSKGKIVDYSTVNLWAVQFIDLLTQKVEEMNYRARDVSLQCLIKTLAIPQLDKPSLIDRILIHSFPDKDTPWRQVLAKLDILKGVMNEFGIVPGWNWQRVFETLVITSLEHTNPDVKIQAVELTLLMNGIYGDLVR
jgi:hypothetical protein